MGDGNQLLGFGDGPYLARWMVKNDHIFHGKSLTQKWMIIKWG